MRRVGILGGMGPQATILIMQKLIACVSAEDDSDHIPLIVDQNPQVPSRIAHLIEGMGADPGPVLAGMARRLVAAGAEALAMPCNTGPGKAGANEPSGYPAAPSARRCTGERNAPVADEIVSVRCDIRLPLTFSLDDCDLIADHILREAGGTGVDA